MTKEKLAFQEALAFEVWMRETVRSVHYADNSKMADAYDRVFNNALEIVIYENTKSERARPS
jgi:hypothetical protein